MIGQRPAYQIGLGIAPAVEPVTVTVIVPFDEVLDEVQLVPQAGQLPTTLSSGQRRRLALATALVRPRRLLVLDEPEQRLDVEGVAWLAARLQAERKEGLAVVFASHDPYLVREVATREVHLGGGTGGPSAETEETIA